jgi:hypothetical protein
MEPTQPTTPPTFVQPEPKEHIFNKFLRISLITLVIISIGLGGFLFLQLKNMQKAPGALSPTPVVLPTTEMKKTETAISPTPEASNPASIDVGSVETDLKNIGTDVQGLQ